MFRVSGEVVQVALRRPLAGDQSSSVGAIRKYFAGPLEIPYEFRELVEAGGGFEPVGIVDGGGAGHDLSGGDVPADAGLGGDHDAVADGVVAGACGLTGEDDIFSDPGGAGEADLRAEEGIFTDGAAVADLDEVIYFGSSANAGLADRGPVDGGVGLDLDVVFEDGGAGLEDLVPGGAGGGVMVAGEAEAVGSDDGTVLEGDVVAELAILADDGVGVGEEVVADGRVGVEDDVGRITALSPRVTWSMMTAWGPIWALAPILAVGAMTAVGWMPGA